MKILHCCLSCFYIDNYNYQENILPSINKMDGHEVRIIASTETFVDNFKIGYIKPNKYFTNEGIEIERIPYKKYLPFFVMKKIRHYKNVYELVDNFSPDVILFHGAAAYEILTLSKYKKNNPHVKLYLDSHEDKNNSGTNWISKNFLHKLFYKNILRKANNYIDKIFYITYETKQFLKNIYNIREEKLEYMPLGGMILNDEDRNKKRKIIRQEYSINENDILLVHSGKMDKLKRTNEILKAFCQVKSEKLKLILIGTMQDDVKNEILKLIESDTRINFLGWKSGDELLDYLCACDLYVQPGSQSATMQNALCCRCAAALYPHESHKYLLNDSVFYVETIEDMYKLFDNICNNVELLEKKRTESFKLAQEILDYRVLARRLYIK